MMTRNEWMNDRRNSYEHADQCICKMCWNSYVDQCTTCEPQQAGDHHNERQQVGGVIQLPYEPTKAHRQPQ